MASTAIQLEHPVVSQAEWLAARKDFLAKEKEFTHLRDELSRQRRALPWVKVDKDYQFDTPTGRRSLAELFQGRSQLIVYHFMLAPGWSEGCKSCSYLADHFDGMTIHLAHRDVTFMAISRAPIAEIEAFKKRMGWRFPWASSFATEFNYDYHVSFTEEQRASGESTYNYAPTKIPIEELPGLSVFFKDANGDIFHTYSTYSRGLDIFVGTYNLLDHAPKGRDEEGLAHTMAWVRHHDKYEDSYLINPTEPYAPPAKVSGSCCSGSHD